MSNSIRSQTKHINVSVQTSQPGINVDIGGYSGTYTRARYDTTESWNSNPEFIPKRGEIIIYSDYDSYIDDQGETHYIPGIKVGDGNTLLTDLPFANAGQSSGGTGEIVPVFTLTSATSGVCDKTFAEIQSAMQEGRCNRAVTNFMNHMLSLEIDGYVENDYIQFSYIGVVSEATIPHITKTIIILYSDNTASFEQFVVNDNSHSIAPIYGDIAFPIASGSICYYDGELYKAKQDIPVPEPWTPSHWSETTIALSINTAQGTADMAMQQADRKITKPAVDGTAGQVLTSDGNGGQTWETLTVPTNIIDDTAGDGDTNKVWSADKSNDEISGLSDAINAKSDLSNIAPDYTDLTFPIDQGAPCIHDGQLYVANTEIQTSEAWTAGHWTATDAGTLAANATGNAMIASMFAQQAMAGLQGKVDEPSTPGTTGQVLTSDGNGGQSWENNPAASVIETTVEDWLEENISNPDSPPLDRSLSLISGAAPADMVGEINSALNDLTDDLEEMNTAVSGKVDGWFIENNTLYLTANGVIVGDGGISGIGGGGGGGGGDNDAVLTMTNGMDWLSTTIRHGAPISITFVWSSLIDEIPTGNGSVQVVVNDAIRTTLNVQQGSVTIPVGDYLTAGSNTVRMKITDAYGNSRSLVYTINSVLISVSTTFDDSVVYTAEFLFPYTPVGSVDKTVYVKLDGVTQETVETSVSNRQLTYQIPTQSHGSHSIELWFTAVINEETVESNHIYREYIYTEAGETDPVIISSFHESSVSQYSTVPISYRVYDPASQQCEITIYENDVQKAVLTVGRDEQTYTYRALSSGLQTITIVAGETEKEFSLNVASSGIDVEAETDGLQLYLSSSGRSNAEANPATWVSGSVETTFTGFNWVSDGWVQDADGVTVLRISGGARAEIPYEVFAEDFRAGGRTIELEFATKDVRNYNTPVITCISGGRGFTVSSQDVSLSSEQRSISTQFKDDEHVRLSFVVQKRAEQRLILIYINGIVSGCVQYPDNDDFSQVVPVGITLGGDDSTLDVYAIRVYDHDLTRFQILNNWIADTQDGYLMVNRYDHNNIFDEYGNIVISKLPNDLPYMVLNGTLPTFKGNKLSIDGEYVDPIDPSKSFTFTGATIDVQGTSSQYYARKNYKIKFNNGFTNGGTTKSKYAINDDAIPVKTFTFKADVASSEGANNVELARLYNDACPYRTPYQIEDSKVRQGIDGFPIVIFHNDGTDTVFLGKYNFNNDKSTEDVFGFSDGDESWEIRNNTSNRVLWKSADYSGTDWLNDFEARYPDTDPPYTDSTQLAAFAAWLVSTDREGATGNALPSPVTYVDGETETTYTNDTAAYRLAKFRNELPNHAEVDSLLFYYLFTELFLMVDSRAKNAFPSKVGTNKWCMLPYDFDTALGINNEGALVFGYNLEDTDHLAGGADVFNGQDSVLWMNLRDSYGAELKSMYQSIRSTGAISYAKVEGMFEAHQGKWPEAIFNEDAQYKYLDPLINDNDASYLGMLQGSKEEQRKWWMYNRFRYIDSKYNAGDALTDVIQLRGYAKADITVTPYADIYPAVKYGSYLVTSRGTRNVPMTLVNPLDNVNDTEIYIYSCSQLASVGDISGLKVGFADFSKAVKLQQLKIGDSGVNYTNGNLTELYLGNNTLLKSIDVRNCTALVQAIDLSGCTTIEDVYFDNTAITGLSLPNGGVVKTLHVPGTITNLTVLNQPGITDFSCPDYSNITTLRLENVSDQFDAFEIIGEMAAGSRVRLYNFHWELDDLDDLADLYDTLDTMRGLDQNGNNTATAQLFGTVHVHSATGAQLAALGDRYSDVTVTYDVLTSNLYYYDFYGTTLLNTEQIVNGGTGIWSTIPSTPSSTAQYTFGTFRGWSLTKESSTADANARRAVTADRNVYAAFTATVRTYTITFAKNNDDGGGTLYTQSDVPYGTVPVYAGETPTSTKGEDYEFNGWSPALAPVTGPTTYYAAFRYVGSVTRGLITRVISNVENDTITLVGDYAFSNCKNLTNVSLPAVTSIGISAFNNCADLASVSLPVATSIGNYAFGNCTDLASISLPVATSVGTYAFNGCRSLTSISLPVATSINANAFSACSSLTDISLPAVTSIGNYTFGSCSVLTSVSLPVATSIGISAFSNCSGLANLSLPLVTYIGQGAFSACRGLTNLLLPSVTSIDTQAFYNCSNLASVSLPAATSIGNSAFFACDNLASLILGNTSQVATLVNANAIPSNATVYVPDALVDSYKAATNWSSLASQIKGISELPT